MKLIRLTFLLSALLAGAAALLYTLKVPQGIIYSGGFLLGIKAFSAAVLGGIGNLRGLKAKEVRPKHSGFKAYESGYIHVDVKYLPHLLGECRHSPVRQ